VKKKKKRRVCSLSGLFFLFFPPCCGSRFFFLSFVCVRRREETQRRGEANFGGVFVCFCGGKGSPGSFLSVHDDGFLCGFLYFFFAMILAVFSKKDEEILRTEREREQEEKEEEEETGKCVLVQQTKPDLLLLRALSFFLVDERRHVRTTLDKRERLLLGITTYTASFFLSFFRSLFFSLVCLSFLSSCWNLFLSFGLWLFLPMLCALLVGVSSINRLSHRFCERKTGEHHRLVDFGAIFPTVGGRKEKRRVFFSFLREAFCCFGTHGTLCMYVWIVVAFS
jgi:hypothetical protein